jgi:hypothetical protein
MDNPWFIAVFSTSVIGLAIEIIVVSKTADYDPLKIILTANIDPP